MGRMIDTSARFLGPYGMEMVFLMTLLLSYLPNFSQASW